MQKMTIQINKLYNEDCLNTMSKMPDNFIDLTVTSPPYNLNAGSGLANKYNKNFKDNFTADNYFSWSVDVITELLRVSKIICWNIQFIAGNKDALLKYLGHFACEISEILIWDKTRSEPAMSDKVFNSEFEFILIFAKNGGKRKIEQAQFSRGCQSNILRIPKNKNKTLNTHSAAFPLELPNKLIHIFSKKNDLIYDPFTGTGTTLISAINYKRNFIGSEIVEDYYKMANKNITYTINQKQIFN